MKFGFQNIGVALEQRALARNASPQRLARLEYTLFRIKSLLQKKSPPFSSRADSARYLAANRLLDLGQTQAAFHVLQKLLKKKATSCEVCTTLGTLLLRSHKFDQALEQFHRALSLEASHTLALIGAAHCHAHTGDRSLWLQSLERLRPMMTAHDTLTVEEQLELARALLTAHEHESAKELLLQTTTQYPSDEKGWAELVTLYRNTGEYQEALNTLTLAKEATSLTPHLEWFQMLLEGDLAVYTKGKRPCIPSQTIPSGDPNIILHVLESSLPDQTSGYSYRSHHILCALAQMGYSTKAVTRPGFATKQTQQSPIQVDEIDYHRILSPGHYNYRCNPLDSYLQAYSEGIGELVTQDKPAIIHAHSNFKNGFAAYAVAKAFQIPFVYELRGLWEDTQVAVGAIEESSDRYQFFKAMENECLQQADAVITLSQTLKNDLIQRAIDPHKIWIVPNGVDLEQFPLLPKDTSLASSLGIAEEIVLGYIGSLSHYEGLELLLESFQDILEHCPNTKLLIIGSGPMESRLHELRNNLQLQEQIILPGRIPQDEVAQYSTLIDIMVLPRLPSRVCNLVSPLKPVEAMATGKALLMSDLPVLQELSGSGTYARHFAAGCTESLTFEAIHLIKDAHLRNELGSSAKDHIRKHLSWAKVCQTYKEVYSSLLTSQSKHQEQRAS